MKILNLFLFIERGPFTNKRKTLINVLHKLKLKKIYIYIYPFNIIFYIFNIIYNCQLLFQIGFYTEYI